MNGGDRRAGDFTFLVDWRPSAAIRRGTATNRLGLACVGDRITAEINGMVVAEVQDDELHAGTLWFGVASFDGRTAAHARFDNLEITAD